MKKLLITLDESTATLLADKANKAAFIRQALKVYNEDISTDTIVGLRDAYIKILRELKDLHSKIDYIAGKL